MNNSTYFHGLISPSFLSLYTCINSSPDVDSSEFGQFKIKDYINLLQLHSDRHAGPDYNQLLAYPSERERIIASLRQASEYSVDQAKPDFLFRTSILAHLIKKALPGSMHVGVLPCPVSLWGFYQQNHFLNTAYSAGKWLCKEFTGFNEYLREGEVSQEYFGFSVYFAASHYVLTESMNACLDLANVSNENPIEHIATNFYNSVPILVNQGFDLIRFIDDLRFHYKSPTNSVDLRILELVSEIKEDMQKPGRLAGFKEKLLAV